MDGRLEQAGDRWQLQFTRKLPHPPEKVWRALTEPEHLQAWFPSRVEGELKEGAILRFVFEEHEVPPIEGRVHVYEPPSVLEFAWGDDNLRFEVQPDGDGSVLRLADTFDELGKAARDGAGWHVCLEALEHHLRGEKPPWDNDMERWQQVHPSYVERFGPEASSTGPPESKIDQR
jgi:uncharacterized protein YndB with AHSA1/START domain